MTVDPELPEPLYQQVAAILRERIASGELAARIPSLKTIAETYGVSHVTAEKAMNLLRDEGLIVVVIGRGAYVARPRPREKPQRRLGRWGWLGALRGTSPGHVWRCPDRVGCPGTTSGYGLLRQRQPGAGRCLS